MHIQVWIQSHIQLIKYDKLDFLKAIDNIPDYLTSIFPVDTLQSLPSISALPYFQNLEKIDMSPTKSASALLDSHNLVE